MGIDVGVDVGDCADLARSNTDVGETRGFGRARNGMREDLVSARSQYGAKEAQERGKEEEEFRKAEQLR